MVDEARNVVSYIHSLYAGNGVVAGDSGILHNNRMGCFSLDENSPNRLAPGTLGERGYTVQSIGDWAGGGAAQLIEVEDWAPTGAAIRDRAPAA